MYLNRIFSSNVLVIFLWHCVDASKKILPHVTERWRRLDKDLSLFFLPPISCQTMSKTSVWLFIISWERRACFWQVSAVVMPLWPEWTIMNYNPSKSKMTYCLLLASCLENSAMLLMKAWCGVLFQFSVLLCFSLFNRHRVWQVGPTPPILVEVRV